MSHESAEAREAQVSSARVALISQAASLLVNVDEAPFYRHHRAFSPGVQEFIGARRFHEMRTHGSTFLLARSSKTFYCTKFILFLESMTFDEFLRSGELLTLDKLHAELYRLAPREGSYSLSIYPNLKLFLILVFFCSFVYNLSESKD